MRLAYLLTHPIQYQSPLVRHLRAGGVDLEVLYASDASSRSYFDPGFGREVTWDVPLLEGYPSRVLFPREPDGSRRRQVQACLTRLKPALAEGGYDAVWVHGWSHPFAVAGWQAARRLNLPLLLRGETFAGCVRGGPLRRWLHRQVFRRRFRQVAAFLAVGTLNRQLYQAYGAPESRLFSMPYAVDNTFFQNRVREAAPAREALRASLGLEPGRPVVLFCGKLIGVKDPATLIRAVGRLQARPAGQAPMLLLAGDGELRPQLESLAAQVAPGAVRFLGFQNQSQLPALYDLCDVFVLPSVFEPWGLVVNEVMNAGRPVVVSDQVGSGADLVRPGINGGIFAAGCVGDLEQALQPWLEDPSARVAAGRASLERIRQWGFDEDLQGLRLALASLAPAGRGNKAWQ